MGVLTIKLQPSASRLAVEGHDRGNSICKRGKRLQSLGRTPATTK